MSRKEDRRDGDRLSKKVWDAIKRDWNTIPNFLSYFRILLIPVFIWLYVGKQDYHSAAAVVIISGLTDIVDGFIARRFNMVSDLGKVLDPAADKLNQVAMLACIAVRYRLAIVLIVIIAAKEFTMLGVGLAIFNRTDDVGGAKWYGKMATVIIVLTSFAIVIFPNLDSGIANAMLGVSIAAASFSFVMYFIANVKKLLAAKNK